MKPSTHTTTQQRLSFTGSKTNRKSFREFRRLKRKGVTFHCHYPERCEALSYHCIDAGCLNGSEAPIKKRRDYDNTQ